MNFPTACHGSDSRAGCVVGTAGYHRTVRSAQPAASDRRPQARSAALPQRMHRPGRRGFEESAEAWTGSGRIHFGERESGASRLERSPPVSRGSGREIGDSGEASRRAEPARRPVCDIHRPGASGGHEVRARQPVRVTPRMMGRGLGRGAGHCAERDGVQGAALRPAGGGISR